jgi:glycosyltransferase involved in cell wall biosynthesis
MHVAAIVPAYQAGSTVANVVRDLGRVFCDSELPIIVVDDGSTDDTAARALEAGARVERHGRNRGKGEALRTGFAIAAALGATAAVTVDADGQHPADQARLLARDPAPATALVLGIRDLVRDGAPRSSRFSNGISNFFLSRFAGRRLLDTQCGLRRYPVRETLALGAGDPGYAYEAEVVLLAARAGWRIEQVPVRVFYPPPAARISHFHVVRDPARIIVRVVRTLARR